jgi:mRNA interferase RelE/StbE
MDYAVLIDAAAKGQLLKLERFVEFRRIRTAINALGQDPRPRGSIKLAGSQGWRIRVGDYRVIYQIDDVIRIVSVTKVGHRRDVYENDP